MLWNESAIKRLPAASNAMPLGWLRLASRAGPSSPRAPQGFEWFPATVESRPVAKSSWRRGIHEVWI